MTEENKTVSMLRYKNVSPVALTIPELGVTIPKDGYSAPMSEPTPTVAAYVAGKLFAAEGMSIPEAAPSARAVTQGDATTEINTAGPAAPVTADPNAPVKTPPKPAAPDYQPFKTSSADERLKGYDNQAAIRDAVANTVVAVGSEQNPVNQFGEIPQEEATRLIRAASGSFSTEVSGGEYVADEAQKIIASAAGVVSNPPSRPIPVPEGVPADIAPFFQQTGLQKKIYIYKMANATVLNKIKGFEKDTNVLSCIDQRLAELEK